MGFKFTNNNNINATYGRMFTVSGNDAERLKLTTQPLFTATDFGTKLKVEVKAPGVGDDWNEIKGSLDTSKKATDDALDSSFASSFDGSSWYIRFKEGKTPKDANGKFWMRITGLQSNVDLKRFEWSGVSWTAPTPPPTPGDKTKDAFPAIERGIRIDPTVAKTNLDSITNISQITPYESITGSNDLIVKEDGTLDLADSFVGSPSKDNPADMYYAVQLSPDDGLTPLSLLTKFARGSASAKPNATTGGYNISVKFGNTSDWLDLATAKGGNSAGDGSISWGPISTSVKQIPSTGYYDWEIEQDINAGMSLKDTNGLFFIRIRCLGPKRGQTEIENLEMPLFVHYTPTADHTWKPGDMTSKEQ